CHPCVAALRLPGRMAVEQVARWPWNAWPDESGLGGRMAWNPQQDVVGRRPVSVLPFSPRESRRRFLREEQIFAPTFARTISEVRCAF
ncbi:hypothetical protein KDW43_29770, partial [Burkholderia vietnamiensis]|uniref:hypothetical protein n=1 Tax=Burkholderia vietnamiensis TaxID=60552 RepID=UPI001BA07A4A